MHNCKHLFTLIVFISLFSCSKDKSTKTTPVIPAETGNWGHLAVGNYWIYRVYTLDSNYNVIDSSSVTDSTYVDKDTVVNGTTFYRYWSVTDTIHWPNGFNTYPAYYYQRDTNSKILGLYGDTWFDAQNYTDTFAVGAFIDVNHFFLPYDTVYTNCVKMTDNNQSLIVPAGIFIESAVSVFYKMNPHLNNIGPLNRVTSTCYSKNIGIVSQTSLMLPTLSTYKQRKLIRYKH